jgi:hypothetical protein
MSALIISLDSARAAIVDRRRELYGEHPHLVPADTLAPELYSPPTRRVPS